MPSIGEFTGEKYYSSESHSSGKGSDGVWFTSDDEWASYSKNVFVNGQLTRSESYSDYAGTTLTSYANYEYINGRLSKVKIYNAANSILSTWVYEYDANGNITKETFYQGDESGAVNWTLTGEYDSSNRLIKSTWVMGTYTWVDTYTYDARGHNTLTRYYLDNEVTLDSYDKQTYNAAGRLVKSIWYSGKGADNVWETGDDVIGFVATYEYDFSGRRTRSNYYSDNEVTLWEYYLYTYE